MKKLSPRNPVLNVALGIIVLFAFLAPAQTISNDQEQVQHQIEKAKIYRDAYPLISETDLYCTIYAYSGELPDLRIIAAEKEYEKLMFDNSDVIFINKGKNDGVEIGQVFLIVEIGQSLGEFGVLASKRGRAQVVHLQENSGVAKVEKACGRVIIGNYLLPFEEKESLLGKDLGYEEFSSESTGTAGTIIYLQSDYNQIGIGHWAIINLGAEDGIQVGQQMTVYKQVKEGLPRLGIGNLIVIDTQPKTATVKILSCKDAVRPGLQVQAK